MPIPNFSKAGRPKSAEKRDQISKAAGNLFLNVGFTGCSMDAVAKHSGVSKQTVYSHFSNKEALFTAVIEGKCEEYQLDESHLANDAQQLVDVLNAMGRQVVKLLHDEQVIAIYRVVIGESASNPRVAELFYQAGPQHSLNMLAKTFKMFIQKTMSDEFAYKCAVTFFNLLKGEFHVKSILSLEFALSDKEQEEQVAYAIRHIQVMLDLYQGE